jgi:outer membrane protein assembly factor BamB/tetratricopeptide (TPR) repeat protein
MTAMKTVVAAGMLAALAAVRVEAEPQDPPEDRFHFEEVSESVLKQLEIRIQEKDWKELFHTYRAHLSANMAKLCRLPEDPAKLVSFSEYVIHTFAKLPPDAIETYRRIFDSELVAAAREFEATGEALRLEWACERYFFARGADVQIERLANRAFERGDWGLAARAWRRLLKYYPDPAVDLKVVAARLVFCAQLLRSQPLLDEARRLAAERRVTGRVTIGDREVAFGEWSKSAAPFQAARAIRDLRPALPELAMRSEPKAAWGGHPSIEMKRGRYDTAWEKAGAPIVPFSIPAYGKVQGREFLVCNDGVRLTVLDPRRIEPGRESRARYWVAEIKSNAYDPAKAMQPANLLRVNMPLAGALFDGSMLYVNMHSPDSPEEPVDNRFGRIFRLPAINSIRAYRLVEADGRLNSRHLVMTSDRAIFRGPQRLDFADKRFHFCWPMVIDGNRLYVGVTAESGSDQESYVACFDKGTLELLWSTYICSAPVRANVFGGGGAQDSAVFPTMIAYRNGALLAQTNLGAVASLDPNTGSMLWLSPYKRTAMGSVQRGRIIQRGMDRPASPPIIDQNRFYVLAMDAEELQIFDAITGSPQPAFQIPSRSHKEFSWRRVTHLVGVLDNTVIVSGNQGLIVHDLERRMTIIGEWEGGSSFDGLPLVHDRFVFVPVSGPIDGTAGPESSSGLRVYDRQTWKLVDQTRWRAAEEWGNLFVFDDYLAVAGAGHFTVWTSSRHALRDLERMSQQTPVEPDMLFRYGLQLLESYEARPDRLHYLRRARETFSQFLWLANEDRALAGRVRECRVRLYSIYTRLGDVSFEVTKDFAEAEVHFRSAKEFSHDAQSLSDACLRLAKVLEAQNKHREASEEYVHVIQRGRDALVEREGGGSLPAWSYARERIERLIKDHGQPVADHVDRLVGEVARKAGADTEEMLRIVETFPATQSVRKLVERVAAGLESVKDPEVRIEVLARLRRAYEEAFSLERYRQLIESLERHEDWERLKNELKKLRRLFGKESSWDPNFETVSKYVSAKLREVDRRQVAEPRLGDPVRQVADLGEGEFKTGELEMSTVRSPLAPAGVRPPFLAKRPGLELLRRGNRVELWDLSKRAAVWELVRPGAHLGLLVQDDMSGAGGCRVTAVLTGSPAAKAGLRAGDTVTALNGAPVDARALSNALDRMSPGAVAILERRGDKPAEARLEAIPASARFPVVAAGFTGGYDLVVVWEGMAVCVDPETGRIRWTWSALRDAGRIAAAGWSDGYVVLFEAEQDRERPRPPGAPPAPVPIAPRTHRLITLSEASGEAVHIERIPQVAAEGGLAAVEIYGGALSDELVLMMRTSTAFRFGRLGFGARQRPGAWIDPRTLGGPRAANLAAWAYVEPSHTLYVAAHDDQTGEKVLRGFRLGDGSTFETPLRDDAMRALSSANRMFLFANELYVCVGVSAPNASRFAIVDARTGNFAGRTLSPGTGATGFATVAGALEGKLLVLYAVNGADPNAGGAMLAYYLDGEQLDPFWRLGAPTTGGGDGRQVRVEVTEGHVALLAGFAYSPEARAHGPVVSVYSRARREQVFSQKGDSRATAEYAPALSRGRLYLALEGAKSVVFGPDE